MKCRTAGRSGQANEEANGGAECGVVVFPQSAEPSRPRRGDPSSPEDEEVCGIERSAYSFSLSSASAKVVRRSLGCSGESELSYRGGVSQQSKAMHMATRSRKGYWRMSQNENVRFALNNRWLKKQEVPDVNATAAVAAW